jgi:hypothetical protein
VLHIYDISHLRVKVYGIVFLPVVLYWCESWSPISREERKLTVFENRVLRKIFGSKRDGVIWDRRKLHYKELHDLYC